MVVEEVEDFYSCVVGKKEVGDIGLPAFVGHCGFEADVGVFRPLFRLWGDEPFVRENAADRGSRRDTFAVLFKVVGNGFGPCVKSVPGELLADVDYFVS